MNDDKSKSEGKDLNFSSLNPQEYSSSLEEMLFDYLDKGYLENIVTFFEHETEQIYLIPKMLSDERYRIKIGAFAIIEELKNKNPEVLKGITPFLTEMLKAPEKNIRGDAAYALEIIGDSSAKPALIEALQSEEDFQVREFIQDALKSID